MMMRDMGSSHEAADMEAGAPETDSGEGIVRWERFLPTMALRVLLVESDDSTRQIIAALLRKCSYRVVAVSDGLKAWEILNKRPHNIDLILTEVDLPSISGFALLTLIQEHDGCKKIPVIMMSSKDSVSTVYKCMKRGTANYLVKPVRINELKNLWQYVWRRQLSTINTYGQQDESDAPQNVEATAGNDAACNQSGKGDNELLGRGSDAQSSYTKPDAAADFAEIEQKQDYNMNELLKTDEKVSTTDSAINLIGAFDNIPQRIYIESSLKSDLQPDLSLSLRQSDPSCIINQKHEENHSLKHSDTSAFSGYMNMLSISPHSGSVNLQNKEFSRIAENNNTVQSVQAGNIEYSAHQQNHQLRALPTPILAKGIRFGDCCSKSGSSPAPLICPDSFQHSSCENNNSNGLIRDPHDQNSCTSTSNQIRQNHELLNWESAEQISPPATNRSGSSSLCNGTTLSTCLNNSSMDWGSGTGEDSSQRSIQREAAVAKFRLKRKDRCFEKKVRYESRKKLAEQRPRVNGQFVRQAQTDGETNICAT